MQQIVEGAFLTIRSMKYLRSGRGPTSDISPFSTFQNCGNSSKRYFRITRPKGVIRGIVLGREQRTFFLGVRIHRTKLIDHERLAHVSDPFLTEKHRPGESRFTRQAIYRNKGDKSTKNISDNVLSIKSFTFCRWARSYYPSRPPAERPLSP